MGWTFTIGVLTVLAQVIHGIISLGKFTYAEVGGFDYTFPITFGEDGVVVREFPVEG